jgi:hypothetical protein
LLQRLRSSGNRQQEKENGKQKTEDGKAILSHGRILSFENERRAHALPIQAGRM